ncbi:WD40-repeat-containing domain protein [Gilbertella persicaria]|uniref:WD40-repeat-containing domain protein n=1 Tax=Gilbertella persicaria TaxID=101096 RepID=UPI00221F2F5D|nr:WD40-repeat-containing domain protein [Gilbertella persicaria]KAI8078256.1 WD40-repeat-containing domain protein [Gilbertella persicaria]
MKATRHKVSYVVNLCNEERAHCLGVNSLAIDTTREGGVLYSAGRDGVVASWDLHLKFKREQEYCTLDDPTETTPKATCKAFSQMHTDWVNDIVLCQGNTCVVSASNDRTIKLWKPSSDMKAAHTIGHHMDYAKCLTYASQPGWVASGGLDRRINIWDIEKSEASLTIDAGPVHHYTDNTSENTNTMHNNSSKCSIYALAVNPSGTLMASGSPEKVVRLWDPRSGKRISKLTGHTDNIRALLISDDGQYILSGSSDSTIKLWSVKAQRCLTTYETHPDSVWSLYSNHPELKVFYSGSRDGLVNKTHMMGQASLDGESECIGLFREDSGVLKIAALDDTYVWTATSSSSIHRWLSVPPAETRQLLPRSKLNPEIPSSALIKLPMAKSPYTSHIPDSYVPSDQITMYAGSVLSIPISYQDDDLDNQSSLVPLRSEPDDVIPGKPGIISHLILHNRRHILTKDTNGEVTLWDLTKCVQIKNFGKQDIEDVACHVNSIESFPAWCSVDTKIGAITVQLHEFNCFDCEMYADEVELPKDYQVREDQRLNIGKWVLANLFHQFVAKEIEQGEIRFELDQPEKPESVKSKSGQAHEGMPEQAPATPAATPIPPLTNEAEGPKLPLTAVTTHTDQSPYVPSSPQTATLNGPFTAPPSSSVQPDYFSGMHHPPTVARRESSVQIPPPAALPTSPTSPTSSNFMNKLKNLSVKAKLTRIPTNEDKLPTTETLAPTTSTLSIHASPQTTQEEEQQQDGDGDEPAKLKEIEEETKTESYSPPHLDDFPPLDIPSSTMIIIAEESAEASTGMDLYRGTVGSLGRDVDTIIDVAPSWLLSYLLYNKTPPKETVKLTFVLRPATDSSLEELPGG